MQSLGAMEHFDFKKAGGYSYEQALRTIRKLDMSKDSIDEQFRRMAFNIIGRNQDDHVKNIAFLMNKAGAWSLSPAFDITYSYNPDGLWTGTHQMSINGKQDEFDIEDLKACAKNASMKRGRAVEIVWQVQKAVKKWNEYAEEAGVPDDLTDKIGVAQRSSILK